MNGALTQNPDFKVFEEELKQSPSKIQNIVGKLLNKKSPKAPIKVNKEHHSPDQVQNLIKYNEVLGYFGGKIPDNLKETWENLNKRPSITQEEYNKTKGDLDKWTATFPSLDPKVVREKYDALPSVELSEADKEAIREYASLKNKVSELEKRPTPEALNQAVQTEKDKYKDYDDNKKKLTDWQEAFPNQDPKQVKEQQGKETKPVDYDSTKEQLKKWTDAFPAPLTPEAVKTKYDAPPSAELTEKQKEAIKNYDTIKAERDKFSEDLDKLLSGKKVEDIQQMLTEYEELKKDNDETYKSIKQLMIDAKERTLILGETIKNKQEAQVAVANLLTRTKNKWEGHLDGSKKWLTLEVEFQYPERKSKAEEILGWIKTSLNDKDYKTLTNKWSSEYDFDGSLRMINEYLKVEDPKPYSSSKI
jgi:hypothetical protein